MSRIFTSSNRWLILLAVLLMPVLFRPVVHGIDPVAYYAWLRSAVIDGDLNVANEFTHYKLANFRSPTPTGNTYNEWAVGSAVLWSPFFLLAHGLTLLANGMGFGPPADGYSWPYVLASSFGSVFYALLGILLVYQLCRNLFGLMISGLAVISVWLSTSLVFYMYSHPLMSHANDTFAFALFLFTWYHTRINKNWQGAALRGLTAGLCALIRQMNSIFVVIVLGEYIWQAIQLWRKNKSLKGLIPSFQQMMIFSIGWWLVYSLQVLVWHVVYGQWIVSNPYQAGAGIGFDWLKPNVFGVLFSTNRGLFLWSPLVLLAVIGWWYLRRIDTPLTGFVALCFVLQLYIVASWGAWSGAAAFGQRFFTNFFGAFALGLAALLDHAHQKWKFPLRSLYSLMGVFILWNAILIVRYVLGDVPHYGYVPLETLVLGQFTAIPENIFRVIEILITRK